MDVCSNCKSISQPSETYHFVHTQTAAEYAVVRKTYMDLERDQVRIKSLHLSSSHSSEIKSLYFLNGQNKSETKYNAIENHTTNNNNNHNPSCRHGRQRGRDCTRPRRRGSRGRGKGPARCRSARHTEHFAKHDYCYFRERHFVKA